MKESDICKQIKEIMWAKGMTYEGLANKAGLGTTTVFDMLNGKKSPKAETLFRALDALGLSIEIVEKE